MNALQGNSWIKSDWGTIGVVAGFTVLTAACTGAFYCLYRQGSKIQEQERKLQEQERKLQDACKAFQGGVQDLTTRVSELERKGAVVVNRQKIQEILQNKITRKQSTQNREIQALRALGRLNKEDLAGIKRDVRDLGKTFADSRKEEVKGNVGGSLISRNMQQESSSMFFENKGKTPSAIPSTTPLPTGVLTQMVFPKEWREVRHRIQLDNNNALSFSSMTPSSFKSIMLFQFLSPIFEPHTLASIILSKRLI